MAGEIDSLNTASYLSSIQNQNAQNIHKKNQTEKTNSSKRKKFSDFIKKADENSLETDSLPEEIQKMQVEEAAIFLKDAIDTAGDALSSNVNPKTIAEFKKSVRNFLKFIIKNNYEVVVTNRKRPQFVSPVNFFGNYNSHPRLKDPRVQINVINEKLENFARGMLKTQEANLKILAQAEEIKGLIVDFLSS